jgi:hypothetical protein
MLEELERKLFLNFIHLDDLAISIKEVEKLAKGDKMISFENRCRRKMGTIVSCPCEVIDC